MPFRYMIFIIYICLCLLSYNKKCRLNKWRNGFFLVVTVMTQGDGVLLALLLLHWAQWWNPLWAFWSSSKQRVTSRFLTLPIGSARFLKYIKLPSACTTVKRLSLKTSWYCAKAQCSVWKEQDLNPWPLKRFDVTQLLKCVVGQCQCCSLHSFVFCILEHFLLLSWIFPSNKKQYYIVSFGLPCRCW